MCLGGRLPHTALNATTTNFHGRDTHRALRCRATHHAEPLPPLPRDLWVSSSASPACHGAHLPAVHASILCLPPRTRHAPLCACVPLTLLLFAVPHCTAAASMRHAFLPFRMPSVLNHPAFAAPTWHYHQFPHSTFHYPLWDTFLPPHTSNTPFSSCGPSSLLLYPPIMPATACPAVPPHFSLLPLAHSGAFRLLYRRALLRGHVSAALPGLLFTYR